MGRGQQVARDLACPLIQEVATVMETIRDTAGAPNLRRQHNNYFPRQCIISEKWLNVTHKLLQECVAAECVRECCGLRLLRLPVQPVYTYRLPVQPVYTYRLTGGPLLGPRKVAELIVWEQLLV